MCVQNCPAPGQAARQRKHKASARAHPDHAAEASSRRTAAETAIRTNEGRSGCEPRRRPRRGGQEGRYSPDMRFHTALHGRSPRSTRRTADRATRSSACPRAGSPTAALATTRRACDGRRAAASTGGRRSSRPRPAPFASTASPQKRTGPPRTRTRTRPTTASAHRRRRSGPRGSQLAVLATYQASIA